MLCGGERDGGRREVIASKIFGRSFLLFQNCRSGIDH